MFVQGWLVVSFELSSYGCVCGSGGGAVWERRWLYARRGRLMVHRDFSDEGVVLSRRPANLATPLPCVSWVVDVCGGAIAGVL